MLKIGVGPSSSHTLGPWMAAKRWTAELQESGHFTKVESIQVQLFGSLSLTGKGHASDLALILGLQGEDPVKIVVEDINHIIATIYKEQKINFGGQMLLDFNAEIAIVFENDFLPFHPNGIQFTAFLKDGKVQQDVFYSIGGGFVVKENEKKSKVDCPITTFKYPIHTAQELIDHCHENDANVAEIVLANEKSCRTAVAIKTDLMKIWGVMLECIFLGCHTEGILPGSLKVKRRAFDIHKRLIKNYPYADKEDWLETLRKVKINFHEIFRWISCFALAVNEVNASLGRVVTAPTNGSAGVIPAVLMYYLCFVNKFAGEKEIQDFLLTAGEIGSIFKKGATISAAMGGCQAEIGVSSAMAAGALTQALGGTPEQVLVAAEIAMEHHLGLTCDPIAGLVQVPCIERNAMGAVKAINAAELALDTNPKETLVPLDKVIETMWATAQDMNHKYKETSTGGLAVAVNLPDC